MKVLTGRSDEVSLDELAAEADLRYEQAQEVLDSLVAEGVIRKRSHR